MNQQDVDTLISQDLKASGGFQKILEGVLPAFSCSTGTIHQINPDSGLLELRAQQGIPEFLLDKIAQIPVGKGIAGAAAEKREAVQMCNLQTDTSGVARPDARQTQVAGSVAVPVEFDGQLVGTLGIGMHEPYDFPESEVAQLQRVADWLAPMLAENQD